MSSTRAWYVALRQGGAGAAAAIVGLTQAGCATALSNAEPAHVVPQGQVRAEMGLDVSVSIGSISQVVNAADSLDQVSTQRQLTEDEVRTMFAGAGNLGFNPPALIPHVGVAYGLAERWEVGLRFAASGWRVSSRHQLLEQESSGVDLSAGIGFGVATIDPPIHSVLDKVDVTDYGRFNIDIPFAVGRHGLWYRWWTGPRLAYSRMSEALTLTLPSLPVPGAPTANNAPVTATVSGSALYVGGSAGVQFGYRWIFIGPELTLAELIGDADVTALGVTTSVSLNAFVIYPSFTVTAEF